MSSGRQWPEDSRAYPSYLKEEWRPEPVA